jgi:ABC-type branched-subunit amino acid transport system ATPase component
MEAYLRHDRTEIQEDLEHMYSMMSMLLVEQNANMALSIANRGYVLQVGEIVLSDRAAASPISESSSPRHTAERYRRR